MSNRNIALNFLESFSSGDPDVVASHVSENFQNIQISLLGDDCTGRDAYRQRLVGFFSTFRQLSYTAEEIIVEGDKVAIQYTMSFEEKNTPMKIRGAMVLVVEDDLITVRTDYWDGLTYLRQTGIDYKNP
ncbi:MAG: nuclear transport factor 2 family protein [Woeseia sp.]